ncbi:MAG: hypothetical protein MJZ31_12650 [Bacteroidales bacterium]|nr:hypothetical protein [Bacteroidales bacterium]
MKKFFSLLAIFMMTTMGVWAEEATHSHEGATPIATLADLTSLMENGGKGYLTADITLTGDITANKEVYLCLAGHMISGNAHLNFKEGVTIDDCGSTERYWQTTGGGTWIAAESAEGYFVTTGGVVHQATIFTEKDKTVNICGGNFIGSTGTILNVAEATLNMSGGRIAGSYTGAYVKNAIITGGQIDHNVGYGVEARSLVMTGGRISDNSHCAFHSLGDASPLFLGGIIENNSELCYNYGNFVVGGDVVIRNHEDIDPSTLSISSETPLCAGAYIELPAIAGTTIPATSDVSPYFVAADPSLVAKYVEAENQLHFVSRIKSQPSSENGYLFDIETSDLASVEYQWYETEESFVLLTEDNVSDSWYCSYGDGKWTKDAGYKYCGFEFSEEPGSLYRLTFTDALPEDFSISCESLISQDGKVLIVTSYETWGGIEIESAADLSFTVEKFSEVKTLVEGQTTSALTNGEKDKSYVCGVNVRGRMLYSAVVTFENNTQTAIAAVKVKKQEPKAVKLIENGKVVIKRGGLKFDLTGKKL